MPEDQLDEILSLAQGAGECGASASDYVSKPDRAHPNKKKQGRRGSWPWLTFEVMEAHGAAWFLLHENNVIRPSRTIGKLCVLCGHLWCVFFLGGFVLVACGVIFGSLRLIGSGLMTLSLGWSLTRLYLALVVIHGTLCLYEHAELTKLFLEGHRDPQPEMLAKVMRRGLVWYWFDVAQGLEKAEGILWKVLIPGVIVLPMMFFGFILKLWYGSLFIIEMELRGSHLIQVMFFWAILTASVAGWRWALSWAVRRAKVEADQFDETDLLFQVACPGVPLQAKEFTSRRRF